MARLTDSRRLTGRNLHLAGPGAAAEVAFDPGDDDDVITGGLEARLRTAIAAALLSVGLSADGLVCRRSRLGLSFAVPAPDDALLTAADALEVGIAEVIGGEVDPLVRDLAATRAREQNPALLELMAEARRRNTPCVVDEDGLTLGFGCRGRTFPLMALPGRDDVPWDQIGSIPVALVTGTNGKTTTTRLLASILQAGGHVVGSTSTDGVSIDGVVVDAGDWSGPGGARRVVRDQRVEACALETARGGLLRRGLAFEGYDVAILTNVADDHFGEFGVDDIEGMADVKCIVARGVRQGGTIVVNAADPRLMARVVGGPWRVVVFGRSPAVVASWRAGGGEAFFVDDGDTGPTLMRADGLAPPVPFIGVADVPLTWGGTAAYNVDNALAAAAAGRALGAGDAEIAAGLRAIVPSPTSSPGRGNVVRHPDHTVVVLDFAHNPAAVTALGGLLRGLVQAGRLLLCVGAPGDRLDDELHALADAQAALAPDLVVLRELPHYRRGRAEGHVPALLRERFDAAGIAVVDVVGSDDVPGLALTLDRARPGDVIAFMPLVETDAVLSLLRERGFDVSGQGSG